MYCTFKAHSVSVSSHGRALAIPGPLILLAQAPRKAEIYGHMKARPLPLSPRRSLPTLPLSDPECRGTHIVHRPRVPLRAAHPGCPRPCAPRQLCVPS